MIQAVNHESLRRVLRRHGLRIGVIGYAPFTARNGVASGPMYECLVNAAKELDVQTSMVRCNWDDFDDKLRNGVVDVVAEPVMKTPRRGAIDIIPYCTLVPATLVFPRVESSGILKRITKIDKIMGLPVDRDEKHRKVRDILHELARFGNGFAVTEGSLEHELCERWELRHKKLSKDSGIADNAFAACNDGYLAMAEWPSALTAINRLEAIGGTLFDIAPLFENARTSAGFAISKNEDLYQFLSAFRGIIPALNLIDAKLLEEMRIEIGLKRSEHSIDLFDTTDIGNAGPDAETPDASRLRVSQADISSSDSLAKALSAERLESLLSAIDSYWIEGGGKRVSNICVSLLQGLLERMRMWKSINNTIFRFFEDALDHSRNGTCDPIRFENAAKQLELPVRNPEEDVTAIHAYFGEVDSIDDKMAQVILLDEDDVTIIEDRRVPLIWIPLTYREEGASIAWIEREYGAGVIGYFEPAGTRE